MKKQEFTGSVEIDGKVVGNRVSVSLEPENSLYLNVTEQRIRMFVYPFTPQMLEKYGYVVDEGIKCTFSGDHIGFWVYGPTGHPGDGEFENRTITKISMEFLYFCDGVSLCFHGETKRGSSTYKGITEESTIETLNPWNFEVKFFVPIGELYQFLEVEKPLTSQNDRNKKFRNQLKDSALPTFRSQ